MAETHRMVSPRKILVKELNEYLTCSLCGGYLIDATTVADCSHTFCRACIVRHFESSRFCPNCESLVHKSKPLSKLRSDPTLQSLIYKIIPSLYAKELQRRADFYHSTRFRANSSCSDDSVLGDRTMDNEEWALSNIGDPSIYFSPDDSISLSVEYYQPKESETTKSDSKCEIKSESDSDSSVLNSASTNTDSKTDLNGSEPVKSVDSSNNTTNSSGEIVKKNGDLSGVVGSPSANVASGSVEIVDKTDSAIKSFGHQRFLQCPAAVRMTHLMKFLRMKFALSDEHRVDIIYAEEILPPYLSLMDVAYTFKWDREKPMRFFYLIYVPIVRPVLPQLPAPAIVATTPPSIPPMKLEVSIKMEPSSNNSVNDSNIKKPKDPVKHEIDDKKEDNNNVKVSQKSGKFSEDKSVTPDLKINQKSVKFTESSSKSIPSYSVVQKSHTFEYTSKSKNNGNEQTSSVENCIYDYTEPDKDEIKAFAERRDREWALQKHADSEIHVSKKRKKNKHSKNESMHKKRKIHAEITSNEVLSKSDDSLKLKVKLSVANGHKHKHRSNSSSSSNNIATFEPVKTQELSPKERLLQMRQVRHKNITPPISDDKTKAVSGESSFKIISEPPPEKPAPILPAEKPEPVSKIPERAADILSTGKTLRSDFSHKTSISKDICNKYVRVNLEKYGEHKNNTQKKNPINSFPVKSIEKIDTIAEKIQSKVNDNKPIENKQSTGKFLEIKIPNIKPIENKVPGNKFSDPKFISNNKISDKLPMNNSKPEEKKNNISKTEAKVVEPKLNSRPVENKAVPKNSENKMAPKQVEQKQTIDESKSIENKLNNIDFKPGQSTTLVTKNFTVSKVETGTKRKLENQETSTDKRPSLEITVINLGSRPQQTSAAPTSSAQSKPASGTQTKPAVSVSTEGSPPKKIRPPPRTIPLGLIQKMNMKSNMNQRASEKCDSFGALDLSAKPNKPDGKPNDFRANSVSPKPKVQDSTQSAMRPKTPIKNSQDPKSEASKTVDKLGFPEKRPNISNLQMLSESAVQIREREMMAKNSPTILPIPNLIKKSPNTISQNASLKNLDFVQKPPGFLPKTPNLIPKTTTALPKGPNFTPKGQNFLSKNLQKLPKLNEINKGQFCRPNAAQQLRNPRPAGQNQTIRNIPNPSLLVRQQNQNRINSMNNSNSSGSNNHEQSPSNGAKSKMVTENPEHEKKSPETKASEPPPLKPIETFKK